MTTAPEDRSAPEVGLTPDREAAVRHATDIAAAHAAEVDRAARFPEEAVTALRDGGLLAAAAPVRVGGHDMTCRELVRVAERLAAGCGATAMIWAMHQIQLACVARHHPDSPLLERAVKEQWLIASVTSEAGVGGDLRRSAAGIAPGTDDGGHTVRKQGTTVSYGADAQGYLVTARRSADADQADQVAVLVSREQVELVQTGGWNTLGMRGTCSPAYDLELTFHTDQVLPVPFGDIAARTMVPLSHLLWSGVWLGLATEAVRRAVAVTRRRSRGTAAPANPSLALAHARLAGARGQLAGTVAACEPVLDHGQEPTITLAAELNALKVGVSQTVVDVVRLALEVTGMAGFTEDGPYSVARILRDVHSAPLMISNHRLLATNSQLLLALRGER
jgi:acyl-CoA dehydrogenase